MRDDDDERMGKERKTNQDNRKESKSKSLSFIYSFQIQISDFNCELINWLIVEMIWDSYESEKKMRKIKNLISLSKFKIKIKIKM